MNVPSALQSCLCFLNNISGSIFFSLYPLLLLHLLFSISRCRLEICRFVSCVEEPLLFFPERREKTNVVFVCSTAACLIVWEGLEGGGGGGGEERRQKIDDFWVTALSASPSEISVQKENAFEKLSSLQNRSSRFSISTQSGWTCFASFAADKVKSDTETLQNAASSGSGWPKK